MSHDVIEKLVNIIHNDNEVIERNDDAADDTPNSFLYNKAEYISAEVFNVKEVMEDYVEKVNPGDVKTEPEELQTLRSNLNLLNITTLDLILKGLIEML